MQNKIAYFWAFVGRFLPQGVYLITTIILARFLSPDDFGQIGVLSVIFIIANMLMDSGLGGSLVKEKEISKIDCSTIFVFNILVSHFIYIILFFCSDIIELYFKYQGLSMVVKIICLVFLINSWGLVSKSLLVRNLQFKKISIIAIIAVLISAFTSVILAVYNYGVYSLVAYQLINALIISVLSIYFSPFRISFKFNVDSLKRLIPFGFFTTLTTIIDTLYENMITIIIGRYYNMQQAGYLYQAKKIEEVPSSSFIITVNSVSFPILTKLKDSKCDFTLEANRILTTITTFLLPVLFMLIFYSEDVITLLYGNQWIEASKYFSLLIYAAVFILLENLNRNFIKSLGKVNLLFYYTIFKRFVGISLILLFAFYSIHYLVHAYILSSLIGFLINNFLYSKLIEENWIKQIYIILKPLVPCLFFGITSGILFFFFGKSFYVIVFNIISFILMYLYLLRDVNICSYLHKYIKK